MKLCRNSIWSGQMNEMELPIDIDTYEHGRRAMCQGKMVQEAFPMLNADQREFILSGMTPDEWSDAWGKADKATWESLGEKDK